VASAKSTAGELVAVVIIGAVLLYFAFGQSDDSSTSGPVDGWLNKIATAIQGAEGVNPDYNNPLALGGTGDTGTSFGQGLGIFSSFGAGWDAGVANIRASFAAHPTWSLSYWIARYTGNLDSNGNPIPSASLTNYQNQVEGALGVSGDTTLGTISDDEDDD
jgi:hypothetical protein